MPSMSSTPSTSISTRPLAQAKPRTQRALPGHPHSRRTSSLTQPGFLFVFVTLFIALGAINGQNNLLFWLFGFSIAALIVSGIITGTALIAIRLSANTLDHAELGSHLSPQYTVHSTAKLLPNFALEIFELDAPDINHSIPAAVLHIRPRATAAARSQIKPIARGELTLNRIRVRTRFPFGLFTKSVDFHIPRTAIVYPQRIDTLSNEHMLQATTEESTQRSINRKGAGLDYFAIRQYQPGDPLRTIAWKQSMRSDSLLVTEYPDPTTDELTLFLAQPIESIDEELFERAVSLIYTLAVTAPKTTRLGLSIPWASIAIPPGAGNASRERIIQAIATLDRASATQTKQLNTTRMTRNQSTMTIGYSPTQSSDTHDLYASDFSSAIDPSQPEHSP